MTESWNHIPDSFHVGQNKIPMLVYRDVLPLQRKVDDGTLALGGYDPVTDRIELLAQEEAPHRIYETLVHEMIEAINFKYELNLEHPQIKTLGVALHQGLCSGKFGFGEDGTVFRVQ